MRGNAAVQPSYAAFHGLTHSFRIWGGGHKDIIELHDDIAANRILQSYGMLGGKEHRNPVMRTQETHSFLCDICQFQ